MRKEYRQTMQVTGKNRSSQRPHDSRNARLTGAGFSLLETALTLALVTIMVAFAMPAMFSTADIFRLSAASDAATWAIQTTRYQAIMKGYPFQLTFNSTNNTYQVASEPPGTNSFANVGSAIPLTSSAVTINPGTVLQFKGNGTVAATAGNVQTFTISFKGRTKTITVSNYGSITVQ
ncbi:MAG TPA: GspH/FimT family pseudopilin [Candidatus Acidoferrales bacterium]|nr:GspH/FimT family pseudopilin [Candidatus Acidoferrales bacterium]